MKNFLAVGLLLVCIAFPVMAAYQGPDVYAGDMMTISDTANGICSAHGWGSASGLTLQYHLNGNSYSNSSYTDYGVPISWYVPGSGGCYYPACDSAITQFQVRCDVTWYPSSGGSGFGWAWNGSKIVGLFNPIIVNSFNGTPTSGSAPLGVSFVDNSTGTVTGWSWSASPPAGVSIINPTSKDTMMYFASVGNYSITHVITNNVNSSTLTKTDYIWVYNSTSTVTTGFQTINVVSGVPINSSINILDIENSSWKNTSSTGVTGVARIISLANHNLNAYASAIGFDDNDLLNQPARDGWGYFIMMVPTGHSNVTPGNVTLYVTVDDFDTHAAISSADVKISYVRGFGAIWESGQTNEAGLVSFVVPNRTDIIVEARADARGYLPGGQSINSGSGSGGSASVAMEISLHKNIVTPTPTITVTGTGTIAPNVTVDTRTSAEKQTDLANTVLAYAPLLVNLFIVLTIVGGIKLIAKR